MDFPRLNILVESAEFSVISEGEGVPVVFLHAGVTDKRMWVSQMEIVAEAGYRAIAYDRRGFGETTSEDVPFSQVEDLAVLLDEMGVGGAVLVGCSQGGRIALDFALAYPERVIALVLVSTALSGAPEVEEYPAEIQPLVAAYEAADEANDLEMLNRVEAHAWLDGPATSGGRVTGALRELFLDMNGIALGHKVLEQETDPADAFGRIGDISQPVLLVSGDLDFPHIIERHDMLEAEMPNGFAAMIEGTAHLPSFERPDLFDPLLLELLEALFGAEG